MSLAGLSVPPGLLWAMEERALEGLVHDLRALTPTQRQVAMDSLSRVSGPVLQVDGGVAVISVDGAMTRYPQWWQAFFGGTAASSIEAQVRAALDDPAVFAVILRVDSPGGEVAGILETGEALAELRKRKLLLAQVDGLAASGAYWLAAQAERVFARPMDLIGSIGVRLMLYDFSQMFARDGIEAVPIVTGPYKAAGAMGTEITPEQRRYFQDLVDGAMRQFSAAVVRGRGRSEAELRPAMDGRVFVAEQAGALGLIDGIQGLSETLALARFRGRPRNGSAGSRNRRAEVYVNVG